MSRTVRHYEYYQRAFHDWCLRYGVPVPAHGPTIARYLEANERWAPATKLLALAAIRDLYRRRGWQNPLRSPKLRKYRRGLAAAGQNVTRPLELSYVFIAIDTCEDTVAGRRDAAVLAVFVVTGMWPTELAAICRGDCERAGRGFSLRVGARSVTITPGKTGFVTDAIARYVEIVKDGPLFQRVIGGQLTGDLLSVRSVCSIVRQRLTAAGAPADLCTPRAIRSGFKDALRASGVGDVALAQRLGIRTFPWNPRAR